MDPNVIRDHNVALLLLLLPFRGNFYVYIDVILEEIFSSSITNSKLSTVISDAPFSGIRLFNQSGAHKRCHKSRNGAR